MRLGPVRLPTAWGHRELVEWDASAVVHLAATGDEFPAHPDEDAGKLAGRAPAVQAQDEHLVRSEHPAVAGVAALARV